MSGLLLNKIKINISLMDTLNFGDGYNFTLFDSKAICRVTIERYCVKGLFL